MQSNFFTYFETFFSTEIIQLLIALVIQPLTSMCGITIPWWLSFGIANLCEYGYLGIEYVMNTVNKRVTK